MLHPHYPKPREVDAWCERLLNRAAKTKYRAKLLDVDGYELQLGVRHTAGRAFVEFQPQGSDPFYGYWQPAISGGPAPLLIHVPGYGAEISAHPELVFLGANVFHVNPRGFMTPAGPNLDKKVNGTWPVMPQTVESLGKHGYVDWLSDALVGIRWAKAQACVQPDRIGLFGTSQGGGTALLLASLLRKEGVKAVAADLPYLTNFPMRVGKKEPGGYGMAANALKRVKEKSPRLLPQAWRALGFVDTMSHAHRLTMPTLLTGATKDTTTPMETVRSLFEVLPGTRSYTELFGQIHTYTVEFLRLAEAWFRIYV